MLDLYNFFNASTVLVEETGYGDVWRQPRVILPGRLAKVALQVDF